MAPGRPGPDDEEIGSIIDSIIRGSPVSVSVADPSLPDCPLIAVSDNFEDLTGHRRDDILGKNCRFLNAGCDMDMDIRNAIKQVLVDTTGKRTFGGKLENKRKDGSKFLNILRLQSIFIGGKRFVVGIQLDDAAAAVSEQDVRNLENAVQRRGVLAKWMWSKDPRKAPKAAPDAQAEDGRDRARDHVCQRITVVTHPRLLTPDHHVEDSLVILVSYRLTAAVIAAMGEGAPTARICQTVAEAKAAASMYRRESRLLCGETNYLRAQGFDMGVSPELFVGEMEHGPTLVVSATNTPRAVLWGQRAKMLVLGSLLNLSALVELIVQQQPTPVILLCAGQDCSNQHCVEHEIICGYLLHVLLRSVEQPALILMSDTARQAMQRISSDEPMASAVRECRRAPWVSKMLTQPHLAAGIEFCLQVDRYPRVLPWYSPFLRAFVRRHARNLPGLTQAVGDQESRPDAPADLSSRKADVVLPGEERRATLRLFLVRHGEYQGDLVQGMAGLLDPRLNERGLVAAQRVAEHLEAQPLAITLFSPLLRCMQTAELIARPHKARGIVSEINRNLVAVNRGDWSGLDPQQVEEHFPGDLKAWMRDHDFKEHGGESFNELMARTQETIDHVLGMAKERLRQTEGPIAVCLVGHSSTVASIISLVQAGQPTGELWTSISKRVGYCSVTLVEFDNVTDGNRHGRVVYIGQYPGGVPEASRKAPPSLSFAPGLVSNGQLGVAGAMAARRGNAGHEDALGMCVNPDAPVHSRVSVVTLPGEVCPEHAIEDRIVVLIDALRMSSTLVTAMGQGLETAKLFSSVMEVTHAVRDYGPCALLGGEQKRVLIPGFDRDNSPRSYLDGVDGKTALFLTTNGTRALPWVRRSKMLVLGSFLNASAVIRTILAHLRDVSGVVFLCSGTERGTVRSHDDELCAGYLLKTLLASHQNPASLLLDEVAVSVLEKMYDHETWEDVTDAFHATPGAAALRKIRLEGDPEFCVQRDRYRDMLPFYFHALDVFFSSQVHYDIPVCYEAPTRAAPVEAAGDRVVRVYFVVQDDELPVGAPSSGLPPRGSRSEAWSALQEGGAIDFGEVALVACSPSQRCRALAELVPRRRRLVEVYSGLAAVNIGDWAGLSAGEVDELYPGALERWREDPDWSEHNGESLREVHARTASTFFKLLGSFMARESSGSLVVVTHGALVRSIVMVALQIPLDQAAAAWSGLPAQKDAVTLVEVSGAARTASAGGLAPDGLGFRVSKVRRGAPPEALSSLVSRL